MSRTPHTKGSVPCQVIQNLDRFILGPEGFGVVDLSAQRALWMASRDLGG